MQADFWHERWRGGKLGFHQETVGCALREYWPELKLRSSSQTLVPLCGKSLDMVWLRDCGHKILGVDLSDIAIESFCMENGIPARRTESGGIAEYQAPDWRLLCGDFFHLTSSIVGPCAAVYDRAALVSWPPDLRSRYVGQLTALTPPGCQTLLITCEYPQAQMAGPPFSVDPACVKQLYADHHTVRPIHREDILAAEPKWRARGVTQLIEAVYHLTRL